MARMTAQAWAKRFSRPGRFFALHEEIFESPAFRDLTPLARSLLLEFLALSRATGQNGRLGLSVANAANRLNVVPNTAQKAFDDLRCHGFIEMTRGADAAGGIAREWRITFLPCNGREPTDEWHRWAPDAPVEPPRKVRN